MHSTFSLGRIFGIPVGVSYTWFAIFILVSFLVFDQLSFHLPRWGPVAIAGMAGATGLLFFGSILVHELAHSLMATRHSLPVRGITLFLLGGVSHISREARRPWIEFMVAVVGPLMSLGLAAALLAVAFFVAPVFLTGRLREAVTVVAFLLGWTNLALGVFNLLPGFPLDGGRVLRAGIWGLTGNYWLATNVAVISGQAFAVALAVGSVFIFLQTNSFLNLWPVMVSVFIFIAATSARSAARDRRRLASVTLGEVVAPDLVPAEATIAEAVSLHLMRTGRSAALVGVDGVPAGVLHLGELRRLPRDVWGIASTIQVMTPLSSFSALESSQPASEAIELLEEEDHPPGVLVAENGRLVGVVTRGDLYGYMRLRRALKL